LSSELIPDEVSYISNVHAHSEVAAGYLLNGQRIIQIPGSWRVYAEKPKHTTQVFIRLRSDHAMDHSRLMLTSETRLFC